VKHVIWCCYNEFGFSKCGYDNESVLHCVICGEALTDKENKPLDRKRFHNFSQPQSALKKLNEHQKLQKNF
jgi:hypothetical protein